MFEPFVWGCCAGKCVTDLMVGEARSAGQRPRICIDHGV